MKYVRQFFNLSVLQKQKYGLILLILIVPFLWNNHHTQMLLLKEIGDQTYLK